MKFYTLPILFFLVIFFISSVCICKFSVYGQNIKSSFQHSPHSPNLQTTYTTDTGLIDALPQKPTVNAKALENAMKISENTKNGKTYDLILFTALTLGLYYLSFFLYKINLIRRYTHRKIWNLLLLLMAIVAVMGGFVATVQLQYDIMMNWYKDILFWHVEAGISMTFIAIFHFWWHKKYFINIFYIAGNEFDK